MRRRLYTRLSCSGGLGLAPRSGACLPRLCCRAPTYDAAWCPLPAPRSLLLLAQLAAAGVGQTERELLKEAVREPGRTAAAAAAAAAEEEDEGSDDGDAANPLWGQREDKQIQVRGRRRGLGGKMHGCALRRLDGSHRQQWLNLCQRWQQWAGHGHTVRPTHAPALSRVFQSSHFRPIFQQSLMEMVSGGAASMEELQQRLETELAALEVGRQAEEQFQGASGLDGLESATLQLHVPSRVLEVSSSVPSDPPSPPQDASVHEILENGGSVARVLGELGGALQLLGDLEENLSIFDAKLRHMREHISGGRVVGGWWAGGSRCIRGAFVEQPLCSCLPTPGLTSNPPTHQPTRVTPPRSPPQPLRSETTRRRCSLLRSINQHPCITRTT